MWRRWATRGACRGATRTRPPAWRGRSRLVAASSACGTEADIEDRWHAGPRNLACIIRCTRTFRALGVLSQNCSAVERATCWRGLLTTPPLSTLWSLSGRVTRRISGGYTRKSSAGIAALTALLLGENRGVQQLSLAAYLLLLLPYLASAATAAAQLLWSLSGRVTRRISGLYTRKSSASNCGSYCAARSTPESATALAGCASRTCSSVSSFSGDSEYL